MADTVVQLPGHPLRGIAIRQHGAGSPNKIVIVEKAALRLQTFVFGLECLADPVQRCRQLPTALRRPRRQHRHKRRLRRLLHDDDVWKRLTDGLVREASLGQRAA